MNLTGTLFKDIKVDANGIYLMISSSKYDWIVKLELNAGLVWSYSSLKRFKENTLSLSKDGEFLIIGTETPYYLLKINSNTGDIQFAKT